MKTIKKNRIQAPERVEGALRGAGGVLKGCDMTPDLYRFHYRQPTLNIRGPS